LVQGHAMRAWKEGLDFRELVLADKNITGRVPRKQVERAFDLQRQLRNIDKIFERVFPPHGRASGKQRGAGKSKQRR
jgi:adenylosuccinate lyase